MANLTRAQRHNRMLDETFNHYRQLEAAKSIEMKLADELCTKIWKQPHISGIGAGTHEERAKNYGKTIETIINILKLKL